jgi:hypothetical protein
MKQQIIGWREWVEFPDWELRMRAKVDTGARSSAIDCGEIIELPGDRVRFTVRLDRKQKKLVTLEEPIKLRKHVRSSTGQGHNRIFVETTLRIAGVEKRIDISLVCRKTMIHRFLLGREGLGGEFLINSSVDHWATPRRRVKSP